MSLNQVFMWRAALHCPSKTTLSSPLFWWVALKGTPKHSLVGSLACCHHSTTIFLSSDKPLAGPQEHALCSHQLLLGFSLEARAPSHPPRRHFQPLTNTPLHTHLGKFECNLQKPTSASRARSFWLLDSRCCKHFVPLRRAAARRCPIT